MKKLGLIFGAAALMGLASCDKEEETMYVNGDYKAEVAEFSHGWKEFIEVSISGDMVSSVNYDAIDPSGDTLKSSLTFYPMPDPPGLPSAWYPLLEAQYKSADIVNYDAADIDGITGATHTSETASMLFDLILEAAKEGDTSTQVLTEE